MRIGISLTSHHDVADTREGARWMIERAQAARRAGLDSLFLGDHYAVAKPYYQNVPMLGRLVGQGSAYRYLVRSVRGYPGPQRIAEIMREAGLEDVRWFGMSGGIVTLHSGTVPKRQGEKPVV